MKKFSLFLPFLLLISLFSYSQQKGGRHPAPTPRGSFPVNPVKNGRSTNTVLQEDFQDVNVPSIPAGWTSLSPEGDITTGDAQDANQGGYFPVPDIPGNIFAMANDDLCNCDMSNIRLISPSFDLSGLSGMVLRFNAYHDQSWGGGDATAQISTDGGSTWDTLKVLNSDPDWQYYVLDLSAYTGNANVKVKFQWSDGGTWASGFAIDNVVVDELLDNDLRVEKVHTSEMNKDLEYTALPLAQAEQMTVGARLKNNGSSVQTNTRVGASISREGQTLYTDTSSSNSLDSMQYDSYWIQTSFTPDSLGMHRVGMEALSDQSEGYPADNVMSDSVRISCNSFARDRGNYQGNSFGEGTHPNGSELGFQVGNLFGVRSDVEATAVRVLLDSATEAGAKAKGMLLKLDTANNSFDTLAISSPYTVQSGDVSSISTPVWTDIAFDSSIALDSGSYYLATAGLVDSSSKELRVATSGVSPHGTSYYGIDSASGWNDIDATPMLRLITPPFALHLPEDTSVCADSSIVLDAGAGDAYDWSTGDQSRTIEVGGPSTYTVTVTRGQCQVMDSVVVDTVEGCATSLRRYGKDLRISVHPNPAEDRVRIKKAPRVGIEAIELRDLKGRRVREYRADRRMLEVGELSEGVYLLRFRTSDGLRVKRLVLR